MALLLSLLQWILFSTIISTTIFYLYTKFYIFKHWKKRGVKQLNPEFPLGDLHPLRKGKSGVFEIFNSIYFQTKKYRYVGIYNFVRPCLLVNDPELVKCLIVRDASYFPDRGTYCDSGADPLSAGLFQMSGAAWRHMRMKLSPAFTSGKIKGMLPIIQEIANRLQDSLKVPAEKDEEVEIRDLLARYSIDIIASIGFGEEIDSIGNPNQMFREAGRKVFEMSAKNALRFIFILLAPKLFPLLNMKIVDQDVEDFFISMVDSNLENRIKQKKFHKDFLQSLLQLRNTGSIKLNDDWNAGTNEAQTLTLQEITAQAFTVYAAGFETTSSTVSFSIYELAKNQDILAKVQAEIDSVLNRFNGTLNYEAYQEMTYLENCINETLRKYPPLPMLQRVAVQKYQLPDSDFTIEPGTLVVCPIMAIQNDPDLYPEPEKYKPERFTDPKYQEILKTAYYPFGDGPRICIGMRLGKLIAKVGLVSILMKYHFELGVQHKNKEMKFNKHSILLTPESGIHLKVMPRQLSCIPTKTSQI